jgi:hypothetical protein
MIPAGIMGKSEKNDDRDFEKQNCLLLLKEPPESISFSKMPTS